MRRTAQVTAGIPIWNGDIWYRALDPSGPFWSPGWYWVGLCYTILLLCNPMIWNDSFSERHWCTWTRCWPGTELGISWLQGWLVRQPWKLWIRKPSIIICFYSTPGNKSLGTPAVNEQAHTKHTPSCTDSFFSWWKQHGKTTNTG